MAARPVTQADYDAVAELHTQGLTRNAIARTLNRSGKTVSRIAESLGLTFERGEQVKAATQARVIDAKARRAALAVALLDDAERLRQQLWKQSIAFNIGGKNNVYTEHPIPEPTFADKRNIIQAVGVAIDRAVKLDSYDADPGLEAAKSMLGALAAGLGAAYEQLVAGESEQASDAD